MTDINANMTDAQEWIPLSAADAASLESGYYTIESEHVEVFGGYHATPVPDANGNRSYPLDGRLVRRGAAGSTAATHADETELVRYYPEAPSGEGDGLSGASLTAYVSVSGISLSAATGDDQGGGTLTLQAGEGEDAGGALFAGGNSDGGAIGASLLVGGADDGDDEGGNVQLEAGSAFGGGVGAVITVGGGAVAANGDVTIEAGLIFLNLPTADPHVAGALWADTNVVTVSTG